MLQDNHQSRQNGKAAAKPMIILKFFRKSNLSSRIKLKTHIRPKSWPACRRLHLHRPKSKLKITAVLKIFSHFVKFSLNVKISIFKPQFKNVCSTEIVMSIVRLSPIFRSLLHLDINSTVRNFETLAYE
jgi:hypothetical protein